MLTLITPTSDRPRAFELCEHWMARQTYSGSLHWIVVDDGREPVECTRGQDHVRRPPGDEPSASFLANFLAGFQRAQSFGAQRILCIEDDDWYAPGYLQQMHDWLADYELCGQGGGRYYNLQTRRWKNLNHTDYVSLCKVGFRRPVLDWVVGWIESGRASRFLDMEIWRRCPVGNRLIELQLPKLCIGTKGLPGKGGLGHGHRMKDNVPTDHDGSILRQWVGDEAAAMLEQYREAA